MARPATTQLLVGTERHDRGIPGRPSYKGLSCGQGSVARDSIIEPDDDLLEVPKEEVVRELAAQWRCWWVNPVTREGTHFTIVTRLLWSSRVSSGDWIFTDSCVSHSLVHR